MYWSHQRYVLNPNINLAVAQFYYQMVNISAKKELERQKILM